MKIAVEKRAFKVNLKASFTILIGLRVAKIISKQRVWLQL